MVVCKFFLQGNCTFGDFCKFEHQLTDNFNSYQNSTSILRQSQFGNTRQPQQHQQHKSTNPTNVDTSTLVKSVVNDMTVAEKGSQWLLSCYAPFKEKPGFPGFEDHCFEEIRLGYYEAVKNGTVEQYKQQVQMLLQQAVIRIKSLQSPSPDIVNLLKCIYNTPPASHCGVYGSNTVTAPTTFGNTTNTSGSFGQQQSSLFGQQSSPSNTPGSFGQQQSPLFGQQSNTPVFAQSNQNIFGKPQPQNQFSGTSGSTFVGGTPQNQVFKVQTSNSIFGNTQTAPQNSSNSIFQQASNFGAQGSNPIFGVGQPIAQANSASIFGGQSNKAPIFGGVPSIGSSVFGGQQTNSSIFRGQQNTPPTFVSQPQIQQSSGNVFSSTFANQNVNTFGQNIFGASSNVQVSQPMGVTTTPQNVPQQTSTNVFGIRGNQLENQTSPKPLFAQQQPSVFNQQSTNAVFNTQTTNSPFGQVPSNISDAKSHSSSIFGSSQNTASYSPFGQVQQQVDETIYSKLEDLTEEEIKWFESDDLDILKIPEKPPTYQMCFKT